MSGTTSRCQRPEQILMNLRKLSGALHSTDDVKAMMDNLATACLEMFDAENCILAFCYHDGVSDFRYLKDGVQQPVSLDRPGSDFPGRVVFAPEPLLCNDTQHDPRIDSARAKANGVRSLIYTPAIDERNGMIGYLEVQNKKETDFTNLDLEQLTTVGLIAAHSIVQGRALRKLALGAAELEQRVAERTVQLREMNEELGAFAYSVSHDLRAPLRAIQAFSEILLENRDRPLDSERVPYLERILAAARGMESLVTDVLAYSRVNRQELLSHSVELGQVVQDAVEQLRLTEGEGFQVQVAEALPRVKGDHTMLVQVILNLLSNALKYVAPGVTPDVRVWAEQQESTVRLVVQDNGIGIAAEDQGRIFRVFERLHGVESYPGTGLGLAIARRAVIRLGGRIGVQSTPGEGSRFWIELPAG